MRYLVLTAALSACYSPSFSDCSVTCPAGSCPAGLECDPQGNCREPGYSQTCSQLGNDGGSINDPDGDGVDSSRDNCPDVNNPDQGNEDSDDFGDACDLCPIVSSQTLPGADDDSDGDRVGNACDPNGNSPTETRLIFDGFTGAATNAQVGGTWDFANGTATATTTEPEFAELLWPLADYDPTTENLRVLALLQLNSLDIQPSNYGIGAGAASYANFGEGLGCEAGALSGAPSVFQPVITVDGDSASSGTPAPIGSGSDIIVDWTRTRDSTVSCIVNVGSGSFQAPPGSVATAFVTNVAGIHVRGVSASFQYVYIVKSTMP